MIKQKKQNIMKSFNEFVNEKKKASPAQLAARKKFTEMLSKKKGNKDDKTDDTDDKKEKDKKPCNCKGLTAKQKKLPQALQDSILKKQKSK